MEIPIDAVKRVVKTALEEDVGPGDVTTEILIQMDSRSRAVIVSKETGIIAGLPAAAEVFRSLDKDVKFNVEAGDGELSPKGRLVAEISGLTRAILTGERTALNILGRLSGIATMAKAFSVVADKYGVEILDTRKTIPGLRALEKYAVAVGGGTTHRMGLYDAVLIKDNHIKASGRPVGELIKKAREETKGKLVIEAEAANFEELEDALKGRPDVILLDNMRPEEAGEAVKIARGVLPSVKLEISGGITLGNLEQYASCGADMISAGALTHSVKNIDFSLEIEDKK
jgi:nicotinate-nucleotide pyrophosphorylase (carboxylating)